MAHRHTMRTALVAATILGAGVLAPGLAGATTLSMAELTYDNALFSNFNLVTLGGLTVANAPTSVANAEGRILVGGDLTIASGSNFAACTSSRGAACVGDSTAFVDPTKQKYGALTVFGNVVAASSVLATGYNGSPGNGVTYTGSASGTATTTYVRGSETGSFWAGQRSNLNVAGSVSGLTVDSGKVTTTTAAVANKTGSQTTAFYNPTATAAAAFPFSSSSVTGIGTQAKSLSTGLAKLPGSPGVTTQTLTVGNNVFFTANNDYVINGYKYGVVTTTVANLASETSFQGVNNGTNDATLVIVTGDGANYLLPNITSPLNYTGGSKVIYDFVDATTLKFAGNWTGSILAPLANIIGNSGAGSSFGGIIDGSVIVQSIAMSNALYASNLFTGDLRGLVPEPASMALLGLGAAAAAFVRRRRK